MSDGFSGLYIPSKLKAEIEAEARAELVREMERRDTPIPFHDNQIRLSTLTGASGHEFTPEALLGEAKGWIAIGIGAVADRLSGLSLGAYAKGVDEDGDEILPMAHRANSIIESPNAVFSMPSMLGLASWWLNLTGQAYFQVLHDGLGVPLELWPMPPDRVTPVSSNELTISGYVVQGAGGEETPMGLHEVIRVWRPDPKSIYQSLGSLSPQATEYNAERYRVGHVEQTYKNDATPRIVMETGADEQPPTKPESDAFDINWREKYHRRSGRDMGVPAWLPPGFKAHELGQTSDGAMTVEMGNQLRDQMLAAMGVPGSIVGLVQDVNRAAAETNQYTFDKHGVLPKTKLIAGAFTQQLAPQFDPGIIYKFDEFLSPDKDFELRREESDLRGKVRSPNEIRASRGLDDADWGKLPVGSFNDVPYTGEESFGFESVTDLGDGPRQTLPVASRANDRVAHVTDSIRDASSPRRTWERMVKNERKFVAVFTRAIGKVFAAQSDAVVDRYLKANPIPRARVFADDLFVEGEFGELYLAEVARLRERIFVENGVAAFGITDPASEFIFAEVQKIRLDQVHADMVTRVDQHTKNLITRALITGTDKGESVDQMAGRLRSTISNRKRARTIARTEVGKAAQMAQLESFAQSDVVEAKQWNTSLDGSVRDSHAATEAQIAQIDESFRLGSGATASAPLDPSLPAADLVNCRCFLSAVFIDDAEGA